ncbi:hypothetical protein L6475_11215 [Prevotella sp. E9-3]|uniref:hypothetical protein n=1 Tax=Prevotella sp. E9-3 TaxID=2913621 RepID=UPI001EDA2AAC|nr:hypothetical protein [Prevotella sp. E9-3]UKK47777.1 hypothetical protein L6475_11215 [Prevotella sp. E9-3]
MTGNHRIRQQKRKFPAVLLWMAVAFFFNSCYNSEPSFERVHRQLSKAIAIEDSDAVTALDLYEESLDQLLDEPDSSLLRETYFRMGLLFMRWSLPEECITSVRQAYIIDSLRKDTFSMIKSLRSIAFAYESNGQLEQARQIAANYLKDMPTDKIEVTRKIDHVKRYDQMMKMQTELPSTYVGEMSHLTPRSAELETAFEGWIAEQKGQVKMAIGRYTGLIYARSYYVRAFAQLHLSRLWLSVGELDFAEEMLRNYEETNALIRKGEQTTKQILQHHARYQDARSKKVIRKLKIDIRRQWTYILSVLLVSLLIIGLLSLWVRVYRQRQVILRYRIDKLRQWRVDYLQKSEDRRHETEQSTQHTDIYQLLRLKLNGGDTTLMTDSDWEALQQAVLSAYPLFRQRLYELCRLSSHDYHVCLLLKVGMKPSDIARLTIRSDEAISSTRRRLYERAFGKKGKPTDWDQLIKVL